MVRHGPHTARWAGLAALAVLLAASASAQSADRPVTADDDVAALLEDAGADAEALAERLLRMAEQPLDVNRASDVALAQIPALSPAAARAIVNHRARHGPFPSVDALSAVDGLNDATLSRARPYLVAGATQTAAEHATSEALRWRDVRREMRVELMHRYVRRLDVGAGYDHDATSDPYHGSPARLYTRLRAYHGRRLQLNLTLDKDPGEAFRWDPARRSYGYDFASAHLAVRGAGRLETLVAGDFVVDAGQGLVFWRGSSFGKGRETVRPVTRLGAGPAPYGGSDERRFFRGVAASVTLAPRVSGLLLASRRRLDAAVERATAGGIAMVTSMPSSGLHRTASELDRKAAMTETLLGGGVTWSAARLHLGVVGYTARRTPPVAASSRPYRRYAPSGRLVNVVGLHVTTFVGDVQVFGEGVRGAGGALGLAAGLTVQHRPSVEAVLHLRHYPRDLASPHGRAFGERSGTPQNERGAYVGLRMRPAPRWLVNAYADQYHFPWHRFGVPGPSRGHDALVSVSRRGRRVRAYVQLRTESGADGAPVLDAGGRLLDAVHTVARRALRIHADVTAHRDARIAGRVEATHYRPVGAPVANGILAYQELRWSPRPALQLEARAGFFDVDHYGSRIHTYERDLRFAFSVPSFSGRGRRLYGVLRWTPRGLPSLEVKYGVTRYAGVDAVGSGRDAVDGPRVRELRVQVRWRR